MQRLKAEDTFRFRETVFELAKVQRMSTREIGRKLGVSHQRVAVLIRDRLADVQDFYRRNPESLERDRAIIIEQLDAIWGHHFPRSATGDHRSASICLNVLAQKAKIIGLENVPEAVRAPVPASELACRVRAVSPVIRARMAQLQRLNASKLVDAATSVTVD